MGISKKGKKRLLILTILIGLLCIPALFVVSHLTRGPKTMMDYSKVLSDPILYKNAFHIVNEDQRVISLFGDLKPINPLRILEGDIQYQNNHTLVNITVTLKGSKQKGKLDFTAERIDDQWEYNYIRVRTKKPVEEIVVLD